MQNRVKSITALIGSIATILTTVLVSLQASGYIEIPNDEQQATSQTIATILTVLISASIQIYSHYNNPTNKEGY